MAVSGSSRVRTTLIVVAAVAVVALIWYVSLRNSLVRMDETIDAAWSEIDNQLQRRADLIPNLVATVKGFAAQEQEVFGQIADARARMAGADTVQETAEAYNQMQSALGRLFVVVENYAELRSNQNFIRLQDELAGTENRIAVARRRYNEAVRAFNTRIRQFPATMAASAMGFSQRDYFEIDEEARAVPQVSF